MCFPSNFNKQPLFPQRAGIDLNDRRKKKSNEQKVNLY